MKKTIIALALAVTLSSQAQAAGQKHRHHDKITATTQSADPTKTNESEGVVAYSDTTSTDTSLVASDDNYTTTVTLDSDAEEAFNILEKLFSGGLGITMGILISLIVLLFLALPLIAIIAIVWLIVRNRNRRYQLAEKAVENGQQIPEELLQKQSADNDLWRRGVVHMATGLGLVALFHCLGADPLAGIGWLVAFYGAGQAFIGWKDKRDRGSEN